MPQHLKAGSPEGCNPTGRWHGGCASALESGESRGVQPHWQVAWRMCLHKPSSFLYCSPFLRGRGLGGWCARTASGYPQGAPLRVMVWHVHPMGSPEGCNPTGRRHEDVPQPPQAGSPEGCNPFGRGLGVSPRTPLYFPLPSRKGARGMVPASIDAQAPPAGSPEGLHPSGRGLGVSPRSSYYSYSPFLPGRGLGGWSRGLMQRQAWARLGAMSDDDVPECAPNVEPEQ